MARPRKQNDTHLSDTGTSTVANRKAAEKERQKQADKLRAHNQEQTLEAQRETAKRLKAKPEDTRTIAEPDPVASL